MRKLTISALSLAMALLAGCGGNPSGGSGGSTTGGAGSGGSRATGGTQAGGGTAAGGSAGSGGTAGGGEAGGTVSSSGGTAAGGAASGGTQSSGGSTSGGTTGAGAPPSCQSSGPGLDDCGTGESCCTSPRVPGGSFSRTYTNDGSGAKDTADPASISDFRLDKYLVTVGRYRKFVAAWDGGSGYTPAVGSGKHGHLHGGKGLADSATAGAYEPGWLAADNDNLAPNNDNLDCQSGASTWTSEPGGNERLPINCVNWWEAYAFCIWDGGFLPSEAEYVYAAAGGAEQRRYPWGSKAPAGDQQYAIYGCNYPDGTPAKCEKTLAHIAPVGSAEAGAGRWGHLDLVGNLMEWYLDWFAPSYGNPCADCANLTEASGRAPRDGYFASSDENLLLSAYRGNGFYPTNRFYSFGFRCARAP